MIHHTLKLESYSFDKIRNGEKTIEVRLNDEKRKGIKVFDIIRFVKNSDQTESVDTEVLELLHHKSFEDLASAYPPSDFGYSNREDLLGAIYTFYTKEDAKKFGVVGIRVKVL